MTNNVHNIKIINCIFCDDIRTEQSGKEILIGVYTGDLVVPKLPWKMMGLSVWMQIELPASRETEIAIRLLNTFGTRIAELSFSATPLERTDARSTSPVGFAFRTGPFEIQKAGELLIEFRDIEGRWERGRSLLVVTQPEPIQSPGK